MIDAAADLGAILDDCGEIYKTSQGNLLGRFLKEPAESTTASGSLFLTSEPVFYASQDEVIAIDLVRGSWIDAAGNRWFVKSIPEAETAGFLRITLGK